MAPSQVRERFDLDACHIVGMLLARLSPCSDFDRVGKLGTKIEKRQLRLASNRVASGQLGEDGCLIHHSYTSDLAKL
jgi:hypothetical protein